jgi:hypothetical protein
LPYPASSPPLAGLSACGSTGLFNRARPDEMQVTRNAPLVVPPDFALVPPAPGAAPTVTPEASRQAMEALFGPARRRAPPPRAADPLRPPVADAASPGIRSAVGDPADQPRRQGRDHARHPHPRPRATGSTRRAAAN